MDQHRLKHRFADLALQRKLMLLNLTVGGVVIVTLTIFVVGYTWIAGRQTLVEYSTAQAQAIADNLAPTLMFRDAAASREALSGLKISPDVVGAAVYGLDGRLFQRYGENALPEWLATASQRDFQGGRLSLAVPIEYKGERQGSLLLLIDTRKTTNQIIAHVGAILAAALLALLIGAGVAGVLNRFITGHLDRLTKMMRRISEDHDYSRRIEDIETADEIGFLARNFNTMLDQIEAHENSLGHELEERRHAEEELYKLAYSDTLTQLPNRQFFNQHLVRTLSQVETLDGSLALMFIDLDNFKAANDNFGHQVGDKLLRLAAERMRHAIRGSDIVCRLGGDEFAVVLKNFRGDVQVEAVARKMIAAMSYPFQIEGHDLFVGASIGIALAPEHATEPNDLVRCADTAMYRAKGDGKNRYALWQPELGVNVSHRYQMETHLRKAMARRELKVFYQPIHNTADGSLAGMEALLRWRSRELGMVSPTEFIPIAEECGLIQNFGLWVMGQACRHLADWRRLHPHLFVAVNLSARQFSDPRLAERIAAIIDAHELPHDCVELEITESLLLDPSPTTASNIARLQELGLPLAIDDFGTGYSSLSYLCRFPINKIKIDRSFVANLEQGSNNMAIVNAIIGMGRSLGMQLHVEGVESQTQLEWLGSAGCELSQGYHHSRPISAEAFTRYIGAHA